MFINDNGIIRELTLEEEQEYLNLTQPTIEQQISNLKQQLSSTDYKAIKYAEGELSAEEYEETKLKRREWRNKINELEREMINS